MKPKKQKLAVATYQERALIMQKKATEKEFKFAAKKISEAKAGCKTLASVNIKSANQCRGAGIAIQTLCGHADISFEFWQKNDCTRRLGIGFQTAKWFVQIAKKCPEEIKDLKEAASVMIQIYFASEMLTAPVREEIQHSYEIGITQKFFAEITIIRRDWAKVLRQSPMEQWGASQLDGFIKETKWLADERAKAEKLKEEKS